ncbi:unnamed protein product [Strongylus vulgaris]|uniref:Uncharacterized protein n=1 Tax=Strongylus vulgaris TaxID=40348 RepID=A0A3P7KPY8_STRVU|nr:unnamed protein product [Strongylus vulgaris]
MGRVQQKLDIMSAVLQNKYFCVRSGLSFGKFPCRSRLIYLSSLICGIIIICADETGILTLKKTFPNDLTFALCPNHSPFWHPSDFVLPQEDVAHLRQEVLNQVDMLEIQQITPEKKLLMLRKAHPWLFEWPCLYADVLELLDEYRLYIRDQDFIVIALAVLPVT